MKKRISKTLTFLLAFGICFWLSVFHVYADSADESNAGGEPNSESIIDEINDDHKDNVITSEESGKQTEDEIVQNGTLTDVPADVINEQDGDTDSGNDDISGTINSSGVQQGTNNSELSSSNNDSLTIPAEEPSESDMSGQGTENEILTPDPNQLMDGYSSDPDDVAGLDKELVSAQIETINDADSEPNEEGNDISDERALLMNAPAAEGQSVLRTLSSDIQSSTEPESKSVMQPDDLIEGVAYFSFGGNDIPVIYRYSDTYFESGSTGGYNNDLAIITAVLANTSSPTTCSAGMDDIPEDDKPAKLFENASKNIQTILREIGFENISINEDYTIDGNPFTTGLLCGMKKVTLDGEEYTILALFPRSFGYHEEWANNGDVGLSGDMQGPMNATNRNILPFLRDYLSANNISGNLKIWSGGASRGGGLAMLTSALMDDAISENNISDFLGTDVSLTADDIYTYTFGAPNFGDESKAFITDSETGLKIPNPKYSNIYNFSADYDLVRNLLSGNWGISHYGTENTLTTKEAVAKLEDFLEHFAAVQGTTPEDLPKGGYIYLDEDKKIVYSPIDYSTEYNGEKMNLAEFLTAYMDTLTNNTGRVEFANDMQDGLQALLLIYFGNRGNKFDQLMKILRPEAEKYLVEISIDALIKIFTTEGTVAEINAAIEEYFGKLQSFVPEVLTRSFEDVGIDYQYDFHVWDRSVDSDEAKVLFNKYLTHLLTFGMNIGLDDPSGAASMYSAAKTIWASHDPAIYLSWTRLLSNYSDYYLDYKLTDAEKWGYRMVYLPDLVDLEINVYKGNSDNKTLEGKITSDGYERVSGFDPYVHIGADLEGNRVLYLRAGQEYVLELNPLNKHTSSEGLKIDEFKYEYSYLIFDPMHTISADDHPISFSQILNMIQSGDYKLSDSVILEIGGIPFNDGSRKLSKGADARNDHEADYYWISKLIQLGGAVQNQTGGKVNSLDYYLTDLLFDRNHTTLTGSMKASPFSGYRFLGWYTPDGKLVSTSLNFTRQFTFDDSSVLYYARFELIPDDKKESKTDPVIIPTDGWNEINIPVEIAPAGTYRQMSVPNTSDDSGTSLWMMFLASITAAGISMYLLKERD